MNKTNIEWVKNPDGTQGYTWNPITGCLNGCSYCYARKLANGRLRERYLANENTIMRFSDGFAPVKLKVTDPFHPRFWEDRLWALPIEEYAKPRGIFVCDMSDLFGIGIPEEWTKKVLARMWWGEQHRYYLLTNQPQNLIKFSPFPENCWVGVTATTDRAYRTAIFYLAKVKAKVKYLSFEPLLERIDINSVNLSLVDWVIIGAQTKPYKPPEISWVEEIVRACDKAGIPVFLKDNLLAMDLPYNDVFFPYECAGSRHLRQEMPK